MKKMTCRQLGGACDEEFLADSFDEIADMSRRHGVVMYQDKDEAHLRTMGEMQALMKDPAAMKAWFDGKRREFESLPEA